MTKGEKGSINDDGVTGHMDSLLIEELDQEIEPAHQFHYSALTFWLYFLGIKSKPNFEEYQSKHIPDNQEVWPEQQVNLISRLTYSWFTELLLLGYFQPLQHQHFWQMFKTDSANFTRLKFNQSWSKHYPSLLSALHHAFGWSLYFAALPKFIYDCLQFVGPVLLSAIINYLDDPEATYWYGLLLIFLLGLSNVVQTLLINIYFQITNRSGMHVCFSFLQSEYQRQLTK